MGCASSTPEEEEGKRGHHQQPPADASSASPTSPPAIQVNHRRLPPIVVDTTNNANQPSNPPHAQEPQRPSAHNSVADDEIDAARSSARNAPSAAPHNSHRGRASAAATLSTAHMAFTPLQQRFGATEGATGDMTAPLFFYARSQRASRNQNADATGATTTTASPRVRVVPPSPSREVAAATATTTATTRVVPAQQPPALSATTDDHSRRGSLLTPRALAWHTTSRHSGGAKSEDEAHRYQQLPSPTTPGPTTTDAIRAWQEDVQRYPSMLAEDASFTTDADVGTGASTC